MRQRYSKSARILGFFAGRQREGMKEAFGLSGRKSTRQRALEWLFRGLESDVGRERLQLTRRRLQQTTRRRLQRTTRRLQQTRRRLQQTTKRRLQLTRRQTTANNKEKTTANNKKTDRNFGGFFYIFQACGLKAGCFFAIYFTTKNL